MTTQTTQAEPITRRVEIEPVDGTADLLCVYPRQQAPQDCYVWLDLTTGRLGADYNDQIGNAVPEKVWHGRRRRYAIPLLQAASANALLTDLAPLAERVLAGSDIRWNGHNHVGVLDADAQAAEEEIERLCQGWEADLYWVEAGDWLAMERQSLSERLAAGETVDALDAEIDGDGTEEDRPIVIGLIAYLEGLAAEGAA